MEADDPLHERRLILRCSLRPNHRGRCITRLGKTIVTFCRHGNEVTAPCKICDVAMGGDR